MRCLISAGPTREYFDPVRYLSNPSSGRMGYALTQAACDLGWEVQLVSGPVCLKPPSGCHLHPVTTGAEMLVAIEDKFEDCDILIMTAAVMDYRPQTCSMEKIKKTGTLLNTVLEPVPDILKTVAARKTQQLIVGFAAETDRLIEHGQEKLRQKKCDYIIANQVGGIKTAFESKQNEVFLISANGDVSHYARSDKKELAVQLIHFFAKALSNKDTLHVD